MPKGSLRPTCTIDGCDKPNQAHGWCAPHYKRWQRYGDPLGTPAVRRLKPVEERFWAKVHKTGLCWEWTAGHDAYGYGTFHRNGTEHAHRVAWELLRGPIPAGLHVDHLCRNRNCVRPSHLEPVTQAENTRRGVVGAVNAERQRALTQCKRGHLFNEVNTHVSADGRRHCRLCINANKRERRRSA